MNRIFPAATLCSLVLLPIAPPAKAADRETCAEQVSDIAKSVASDPTQAEPWSDLLECHLRLTRYGDATSAVKTMSLALGEPAAQELFAQTVAAVAVEGLVTGKNETISWLTGDADLPSAAFIQHALRAIGVQAGAVLDAGGGPSTAAEVATWHRAVQSLISRHPAEEESLRPLLKALASRTDDPYERAMVLCPPVGVLTAEESGAVIEFIVSASPSDASSVAVVQRCLMALPTTSRSEVLPDYTRKASVALALGATSGQDAGFLLQQAALLLNNSAFDADSLALPVVQTWERASVSQRAEFIRSLDSRAAMAIGVRAAADSPDVRPWRALAGVVGLATWQDQRQRDRAIKELQGVVEGGADSLSESVEAVLAASSISEGAYPIGRTIRSKAWSWSGEQDITLNRIRVDAAGVIHLELTVTNKQAKDSMFIVGTSSHGRPQLLDGGGNVAAPVGPHTGSIAEKRGYFDGAWVVATSPGESRDFELHFRQPSPQARMFNLSFPQQNGYQNKLDGLSFTITDHADEEGIPSPAWFFDGPNGGFQLGETRASVIARNQAAKGDSAQVQLPWDGRKGLELTVKFDDDRVRSVTYQAPGEGAAFAPEASRLAEVLGEPSVVRPPRRNSEGCEEQVSTWKPNIGRVIEIARQRCPSSGTATSSSMTVTVK